MINRVISLLCRKPGAWSKIHTQKKNCDFFHRENKRDTSLWLSWSVYFIKKKFQTNKANTFYRLWKLKRRRILGHVLLLKHLGVLFLSQCYWCRRSYFNLWKLYIWMTFLYLFIADVKKKKVSIFWRWKKITKKTNLVHYKWPGLPVVESRGVVLTTQY